MEPTFEAQQLVHIKVHARGKLAEFFTWVSNSQVHIVRTIAIGGEEPGYFEGLFKNLDACLVIDWLRSNGFTG